MCFPEPEWKFLNDKHIMKYVISIGSTINTQKTGTF